MERRLLIALCALALLAACDEDGTDPGADAGPAETDAGVVETDAGPPQTDAGPPNEVACVDESISTLMLFDAVAPGAIVDESEGGDYFTHHVDATGGGRTPTDAFVYARFEDSGLVKVDIDDETALESTEWDIAFRRFIIRLNSGVSGPSTVTGARTAPDTEFESLDAPPDGLTYREEAYFTDTCEYVSDGSGIGSPQTALSSFWSYAGCVAMTGNVYVVALASGGHVKLEVLSYYSPAVQTTCDESSTISSPSGSGNIRIRWAFLD